MKVSIIIPVFNAEKFLSRCIESLLPQNIYEIVVVNDGSNDTSGDICEKYAELDTRIQVFHQENQGVSAARNLALEHATGEWIAFVDADDWVEPCWMSTIEEYINEFHTIDVFAFGIKIVNGSNITEYIPDKKIHYTNDYIYLTSYPYGVCYLFNSEVIKRYDINFPLNIKLSEDQCFIYKYLSVCKQIATIDKVLYNYFINDNSAVNKSAGLEVTVNSLLAANNFLDFALKNNVDEYFYSKPVTVFYEEFFHFYILTSNRSGIQKKYNEVYKQTLLLFPDFKKNKHFRIAMYSLKFGVWLDNFIRKVKMIKAINMIL